jgi:predicted transcriptional regulator
VGKKTGRPRLEDEPQETHSVTASKTLWDKVKKLADEADASVSSVVRDALHKLVPPDKAE